MSDHPTDPAATATDHQDGHAGGHDDHAHGHDEEPLGPIDAAAWGAGLLGVLLGGVTALAFALSTGWLVL